MTDKAPATSETSPNTAQMETSSMGLRVPVLAGCLALLLFFGGLLGWAAYAPLASAAIASGVVKVDNNSKKVQHLEGGIIKKILVREGDKVITGEVLIELDDTQSKIMLKRLEGEFSAADERLKFLSQEIEVVKDLVEKGLSSRPRLLALQRRYAEVSGIKVRLKGQIDNVRYQLIQSKIRASIDGTVVGLKVHTTGGVIRAGASLMDIVPNKDPLVIEARIEPTDIDVVHKGMIARVSITSFNQRTTRAINGKVEWVSADHVVDDRTGRSYYVVLIRLTENPRTVLGGADLYPGMPAEIMIETGTRTVLDSIMLPVWRSMNRALRDS